MHKHQHIVVKLFSNFFLIFHFSGFLSVVVIADLALSYFYDGAISYYFTITLSHYHLHISLTSFGLWFSYCQEKISLIVISQFRITGSKLNTTALEQRRLL